MAKELNENMRFEISIKTLAGIAIAIASIISMYFMLQTDIQKAMELPSPEITRIEYSLKDELIRDAIFQTQKDLDEVKEMLIRLEQKVND